MFDMIPYAQHSIDDDDIEAVVRVLRSSRLTQGNAVEDFEGRLASKVGAMYAVAFTSGTAALHAAAAASGIQSTDLVVTSPLSFAATANCARYVGARIQFADIDEQSLNLDLGLVPDTTDALIAVHYAGRPVDLSELKVRPRIVIEDAAHALGAATPDGPVGNCAHSDICTFSFHATKNITTGEGGAATTNSYELARRLRLFRNHGIDGRSNDTWTYSIDTLGFNYRLTELQAALGSSQLSKLDGWIARRQELSAYYRSGLAGSGIGLPDEASPGRRHAWHLYVVQVENRERVYREMVRAGIGVQVHYVPLHFHSSFGPRTRWSLPRCEAAYGRLLSLPLFPSLTSAQQDRVIGTLSAAVRGDGSDRQR